MTAPALFVELVLSLYLYLDGLNEFAGEALSVAEVKVWPANGPPPHIHLREDELFCVPDGEFSVLLGGRTFPAGPGAFVQRRRRSIRTSSES